MMLDDIYSAEYKKDDLSWQLSVGVPGNTSLSWDPYLIPDSVQLTLGGLDMKSAGNLSLGKGTYVLAIRA